MARLSSADLRRLSAVSKLGHCNPFSAERIALEREVLGKDFVDDAVAWSRSRKSDKRERPNISRITDVASGLVERIQRRARDGKPLSAEVYRQYWDTAAYLLLYRHIVMTDPNQLSKPAVALKAWKPFLADYMRMTEVKSVDEIDVPSAGHLFACLCQVHRAFMNIYNYILGDSLPSVRLRASVWQSVFTSDLVRYRRSLFNRMSELPSLITGPSGTGKELVARAIGLSQYIPFDEQTGRFKEKPDASFFPINLSALSETLIESELFGHCKGSFTGAIADRKGWLDQCPPHGAIFLDEIGELDPALQVKLLRVVQQRVYTRLGETTERKFGGKIIGATNRDMDLEMESGRFREDLYYRLCADRIQTPGLREQLDDCPGDLQALTMFIARRIAGEDAQSLSDQAVEWIEQNLGEDYPWRGNIRELEQCVSSIMIRNQYVPSTQRGEAVRIRNPQWIEQAIRTELTADELLQRYCTWIYHQTGSYEASARRLGIDRRTVKSKVDPEMLEQLGKSTEPHAD